MSDASGTGRWDVAPPSILAVKTGSTGRRARAALSDELSETIRRYCYVLIRRSVVCESELRSLSRECSIREKK